MSQNILDATQCNTEIKVSTKAQENENELPPLFQLAENPRPFSGRQLAGRLRGGARVNSANTYESSTPIVPYGNRWNLGFGNTPRSNGRC